MRILLAVVFYINRKEATAFPVRLASEILLAV